MIRPMLVATTALALLAALVPQVQRTARAEAMPAAATAAAAVAADDRADPTDLFAALAAANRALERKVRPSVVSVITYLKYPEDRARPEGEWEIEDEEVHPGHERAVVSSGFVAADGTILCCRTPLNNPLGGFADIIEVE